MKTVFTNSQCAHVWAQLKQPHGRSGSMKFNGSVGYSYQTPVAHIMETVTGQKFALFMPNLWGNTTGLHLYLYKRALSSDVPRFEVPNIFAHRFHASDIVPAEHTENLAHFAKLYSDKAAQLMKCMPDNWQLRDDDQGSPLYVTYAHRALGGLNEQQAQYCHLFGLPITEYPWQADADKAIARRDRLLNDPKRKAKAEKRAADREAKRLADAGAERAENSKNLANWLNGASVSWFRWEDEDGGARIRIRGEVVETSQGASVPLVDAARMMKYWRITVDANANALPYEVRGIAHADRQLQVGSFTLRRINADGSMQIGCHYFSRKVLEDFEATLAKVQS